MRDARSISVDIGDLIGIAVDTTLDGERAFLVGSRYVVEPMSIAAWICEACWWVFVVLILGLIFVWVRRVRQLPPPGTLFCRGCCYMLGSGTSDRCPECGLEGGAIRFGTRIQRLRSRASLPGLGVLASLCCIGFGVLGWPSHRQSVPLGTGPLYSSVSRWLDRNTSFSSDEHGRFLSVVREIDVSSGRTRLIWQTYRRLLSSGDLFNIDMRFVDADGFVVVPLWDGTTTTLLRLDPDRRKVAESVHVRFSAPHFFAGLDPSRTTAMALFATVPTPRLSLHDVTSGEALFDGRTIAGTGPLLVRELSNGQTSAPVMRAINWLGRTSVLEVPVYHYTFGLQWSKTNPRPTSNAFVHPVTSPGRLEWPPTPLRWDGTAAWGSIASSVDRLAIVAADGGVIAVWDTASGGRADDVRPANDDDYIEGPISIDSTQRYLATQHGDASTRRTSIAVFDLENRTWVASGALPFGTEQWQSLVLGKDAAWGLAVSNFGGAKHLPKLRLYRWDGL